MRAFLAQQMDRSEELRSKLERAESDAAAWKVAADGVKLLRKVEDERKAANAEARLRKEGKTAEA